MPKRRRVNAPATVQVAGGGIAMAGVFVLFGLGWALLSAGFGMVLLGALREAKVI